MRSLQEKVAHLRGAVGQTEVSQWPTCLHCMELSRLRHENMGAIWIPVEGYHIEPDTTFQAHTLVNPTAEGGSSVVTIGQLYPPRVNDSKGWFRVIAECHGEKATAEVDVPLWWGPALVKAAIQQMLFFGDDAKPDHGLVTRIK